MFLGEWFLFLGKRFFISQETFLYFPGNDFFSTIIRCLWFRKSKPNVNRLPRVHMTPHQLGQPTKRSSARGRQPTKRSSARGDRKFTEKKQDDSMESTCSSSSIVKDELPNTKEKSKKREKYMGGLLDRINGKKNDNHEKKRVPTK